MCLGVDQRQRGTPTATKDDPAINIQRFANPLNIRDQMPCRVRLNTRVGARPATAALVKQNDPVHRRIKVTAHRGATSAARTAMQHHNRNAVRPPALFHVNTVPVAHIQHPLIKRIDGRIKMRTCAFLT